MLIDSATLQLPQAFRVAQLRNAYRRDGKRPVGGMSTSGFGVLHDGSDRDIFEFLSRPIFGAVATNTTDKTKLQAFVEAFDTGTAPTVGYSVTVDQSNHQLPSVVAARDLLLSRTGFRDCDLVARGHIDGTERGLFWDRLTQRFLRDRAGDPELTLAAFDQLFAQGRARLTLMGVPLGQGYRIAINRDSNAIRDGDERSVEYGATTPGCSLALRTNSPPLVGSAAFGLVTDGASAGAIGTLLIGFGAASIPVLGIDVLVDPNILVAIPHTADRTGTAATGLRVPADPTVRGMRIFAQSVFADGCGPAGLGASNGVEFAIR
jgi:hypothetical protein